MKSRVSSALTSLEQLFDKMQEMVEELGKRFADRNETKKAIKNLEKEVSRAV